MYIYIIYIYISCKYQSTYPKLSQLHFSPSPAVGSAGLAKSTPLQIACQDRWSSPLGDPKGTKPEISEM